jgi:GGDEF domain-containing protein
MKTNYPMEITADILSKHKHLSDNEIRQDIDPLYSVRNRLGFIEYLNRVLAARRETV